jgi:hypothetical protein
MKTFDIVALNDCIVQTGSTTIQVFSHYLTEERNVGRCPENIVGVVAH